MPVFIYEIFHTVILAIDDEIRSTYKVDITHNIKSGWAFRVDAERCEKLRKIAIRNIGLIRHKHDVMMHKIRLPTYLELEVKHIVSGFAYSFFSFINAYSVRALGDRFDSVFFFKTPIKIAHFINSFTLQIFLVSI